MTEKTTAVFLVYKLSYTSFITTRLNLGNLLLNSCDILGNSSRHRVLIAWIRSEATAIQIGHRAEVNPRRTTETRVGVIIQCGGNFTVDNKIYHKKLSKVKTYHHGKFVTKKQCNMSVMS
jgi:hypothetical protein